MIAKLTEDDGAWNGQRKVMVSVRGHKEEAIVFGL
jgi:hypothetical protein